jgi:hypothetical protein
VKEKMKGENIAMGEVKELEGAKALEKRGRFLRVLIASASAT